MAKPVPKGFDACGVGQGKINLDCCRQFIRRDQRSVFPSDVYGTNVTRVQCAVFFLLGSQASADVCLVDQ